MTFPIINDYRNALRNASGRFASLRVNPVTDAQGAPIFLAGNFAAVFKVMSGEHNEIFALKCFIRDLPQLEARLRTVSEYIQQANSRYLLEMGFLPDELYTTSTIAQSGNYPVVVMPWIEGDSLGMVVRKLCAKGHAKGLAALTRSWGTLCLNMLSKGIAHGDLKHDNVLVTSEGQLRLIDYDSMYTPKLKGLPSVLLGGASYQHPRRDIEHFNGALDHFSMLVIALSLRALTIDPSLYSRFNTGENLILSGPDFRSGGRTEVYQALLQSPDALVRSWTQTLLKSCGANSISVSGLDRLLRSATKVTEESKASSGGFSFSLPGLQAIA